MKLIPVEIENAQKKSHKKVMRIAKKFDNRSNKIHSEIEMRFLNSSCFKLMKYVSQGEHFKLDELKSLERGLQKSVLYIQKRKKKLVEKKNKKRV